MYNEAYNEPENTEVLISGIEGADPSFIPSYEHAGDAGADLRTSIDFTVAPFQRLLVPTGIRIALPQGYVALVHPRSGLAIKKGITLINTPGTIDAGYRGEIKVPLVNLDPDKTWEFHAGDRIAQLIIQRYVEARFIPAEKLPGSDRAERGFGSTGIASHTSTPVQ